MPSLRFTPLHPLFAAEVEGIDLRETPSPALCAEIHAAIACVSANECVTSWMTSGMYITAITSAPRTPARTTPPRRSKPAPRRRL